MKKFKSLVLGTTMLLAVTMLAACGKVAEPTTDEVIEALVDEKVLTKEQKKEGKFEVKIKDVSINDDQDKATVECELSMQDGPLSKITEYEVKFKYDEDDKEWKVRKNKLEAGETKTELTKEIDDEKVKELIEWESFYASEKYVSLSSDSTKYEIDSHKLDKEAKTDTVTITGTAVSGYYNVEFEVEYVFSYGSSWYESSENVVESSTSYVDGYEIEEFSAAEFAQMLRDDSESFWIMGYSYDVDSDDVTISDVKAGEIEYNNSYAYVDVTFTVKEADVEMTIDSDVVLWFDEDKSKWNFNYFDEYTLTSFKCDAIGTWDGTYGDNTVVLTINDTLVEDDDNLSVTVTITSPEGVTGTYSAYVSEYEPGNLYMAIEDIEWTTEPSDTTIYRETFYGYYDEEMTSFKGRYTWDDWSFTKQQ